MTTNKLLVQRSAALVHSTVIASAPWWRRAMAWVSALFPAPAMGGIHATMLVLEQDVAMSLHVRDLPFSIRCVEGCVWITHPADPGDHVLTAGLEFHASGRGHAVARTFAPTRVLVSR
ncbi:MAG: DUF2917 domain-containing protein [Myxococcales bacterium]